MSRHAGRQPPVSDCHLDYARFSPPYTTKPDGKGTGLGLSIVYGIIESHHGHIDVRSRPRQGSTFEILLPVTDEEPVSKPMSSAGAEKETGDPRGTILVVEDHARVRRVMIQANPVTRSPIRLSLSQTNRISKTFANG